MQEPRQQDSGEPAHRYEAGRGSFVRGLAWVVTSRFSLVVLIAWALVLVLVQSHQPKPASSEQSFGSIVPSDTPAVIAEARSFALFGIPTLSRTVVVQRDAQGLSRRDQRAAVARAVRVVRGDLRARFPRLRAALPLINERSVLPVAREDETTIVTYLFFSVDAGWGDRRDAARAYAASLPGPDPSLVGVTGLIPARITQDQAIRDRLRLVEIATVLVILLIVGVAFRSVLAPLITVVAGGVSYVTALEVVSWAADRLGLPAPPELRPLVVVLLLGIVTDYSVFLLSGMRYRLAQGHPRREAARLAVNDYAPVILTAGLMVAASTGVLVIASMRIFRAFGPGMALTVLIGLAVAITLVPALLALLGRLVFWPSRPDVALAGPLQSRRRSALRDRLAHLVARRSTAAIIAALTLLALLVASLPLRQATVGFDVIGGLPRDAEARVAAEAAGSGFSSGILSPVEIVLEAPGLADRRQSLVRLEGLIAGVDGVAGVLGPRELPEGLRQARSALRVDRALIIAPGGDAVRYLVVLDAEGYGSEGITRYNRIRASLPGFLEETGLTGVPISYAGDTAITQQTISRTFSDLVRIAIGVVVVDLLLLILFLRALAAPLYLLGASILALTASAGITVFIFQRLLGVQDLTYYVPFAAAVLLISLGSDYNIFLVGRIWDEARTRPLREAVESSVPRSARAISVAAFALAASFGLLGLVDLTSFHQLAMLLAIGVLVDALFVRPLLVPSLVTLFGSVSAWPGRRQQVMKSGPETDRETSSSGAA